MESWEYFTDKSFLDYIDLKGYCVYNDIINNKSGGCPRIYKLMKIKQNRFRMANFVLYFVDLIFKAYLNNCYLEMRT